MVPRADGRRFPATRAYYSEGAMQSNALTPRNVFNVIFLSLITLAKLMLLAMTIVIGVMVFMRYVMGIGIRWANELALLLQVWFTFIAMALGVRKRLHISINIMPENLSPKLSWILDKFHSLVIAGIGLVMVYYGRELVISTMRSVLPAMGLRSGYLYLALPVGGALILLEALADLFGIERRDAWMNRYIGEEEEIPEEDVEKTQEELVQRGGGTDTGESGGSEASGSRTGGTSGSTDTNRAAQEDDRG